MIGRHNITVKTIDKEINLNYAFSIKRKITVIRGDSATGKSTLVDLVNIKESNKDIGITIDSDLEVKVLTNSNYKDNQTKSGKIYLVDENDIVYEKDYINFVNKSDNYFIFFIRESLEGFTFSVKEIYEIKSEFKEGSVYYNFVNSFADKELVLKDISKYKRIITEDSASGNRFFNHLFNREVETSKGYRNFYKLYENYEDKDLLLSIVDGAAFGSEMLKIYRWEKLPIIHEESFEFILLISKIFKDDNLVDKLLNTENYADIEEFLTWEKYYIFLLTEIASKHGRDKFYKKSKLNDWYIQKEQLDKVKSYLVEKYRIRIEDSEPVYVDKIDLNW